MAGEIERREVPGVDVMLLPGFAGIKVLWEDGRVAGVQTADKGVNADGSPRSNFEPGNCLKAKVTVFGEGPRGHLARELEEVLGLQAGAVNPQVYETGAKEIWEIPEGRVPDGFVLHSTGWPQADGESGGSFVYKMAGNRLAVGYVVSLDTRDPFADAHLALQKFKTHPRIKADAGGREDGAVRRQGPGHRRLALHAAAGLRRRHAGGRRRPDGERGAAQGHPPGHEGRHVRGRDHRSRRCWRAISRRPPCATPRHYLASWAGSRALPHPQLPPDHRPRAHPRRPP